MPGLTVDLGGIGHQDGTVTVNIDPETHPDIVCDITARANQLAEHFQPESVDRFICSHTMEHLFPGEYVPSLTYWRTFLKPGGKLLVVVPDMEGMMRDYVAGVVMPDVVIAVFYAIGTHKWGWTLSMLTRDMQTAGYKRAMRTSHPLAREWWPFNYEGYEYTDAVGKYHVPNLIVMAENL